MKIVAIVQARMGSTRLPRKTLMDLEGKPVLWHQIERMKKSKLIQQIVVATTTSSDDNAIYEFCCYRGIDCYRGSEEDVLERYYKAALHYGMGKGDAVVRITGDCPLVCPAITDGVIKVFLENKGSYDYVSNNRIPSYPEGLDTEVFTFEALERACKEAKLVSEREHVTPYITKNEDLFRKLNIKSNLDLSSHRWTLDEERDYIFISTIYKHLYKEGEIFSTEQVLELLEQRPDIYNINRGIPRSEGYLKSLENDKEIRKG